MMTDKGFAKAKKWSTLDPSQSDQTMATKYKSRCPAGGLFCRWRADLKKNV